MKPSRLTAPRSAAGIRGGLPERFFRLLRRLRAGKFSLAVDLQGNGESAWLTRLTGAPARWGVVHKPRRRQPSHTAWTGGAKSTRRKCTWNCSSIAA